MQPQWLTWARQLQAIAQNGLAYAVNDYDRERFTQIRAISAEMFAAGANLADFRPLVGLFEHEKGYATPKVDVRAGVIQEGRILLVREREDGRWSLPGGWADIDDAPSRAAEREVLEESGLTVQAIKLAALQDRNLHGHEPYPFHAYKLFFLCKLVGGEARPSDETSAAAFFAPDALPELSLTRVVPAQIPMLFRHQADPALPTEYD
jgi:ADP-ribose pyrophosphatase YjhB (NUDIX family)